MTAGKFTTASLTNLPVQSIELMSFDAIVHSMLTATETSTSRMRARDSFSQ
jgi:hypothetical protein